MASAGPNAPGTVAGDSSNGGVLSWTNTANASASDNTRVNTVFAGGFGTRLTHYLKATNFGFSIPASSTITGVIVEIEKIDWNSAGATDSVIKLVKGGVVSGDNKSAGASWPYADAYSTYGGASDAWGLSMTDADVNASDFGVVLSADVAASKGNRDVRIDHIRITVHYTAGGGGGSNSGFFQFF